jgi:hypothetical protein
MKINLIYILLLLFTVFSCTSSDECDTSRYCEPYPIDSNWVDLELTVQSSGVPIVIYNGNIEDNNIVLRDTLYDASFSYYLSTDVRYTVEAYYRSGPNTIIAVDSKKLKSESYVNCDETCYESDEITLDLELIE